MNDEEFKVYNIVRESLKPISETSILAVLLMQDQIDFNKAMIGLLKKGAVKAELSKGWAGTNINDFTFEKRED